MGSISKKYMAPASHRLTLFPEIENIGPSILEISEVPIHISGGYGDLYTGTHVTAGKVVLKRPRLGPADQEPTAAKPYLLEAEAWREVSHPHVLELIGMAEINGIIHLVSPYIANQTLVAFLNTNPDTDRPRLLGETADAITFLHKCEIIHGDIKASNVLVSDDIHALLFDFGLARFSHSIIPAERQGAGSLRWQSFEVWSQNPNSFKSDAYSFGMTIFEVLTGKVPFWEYQNDYAIIQAAFFRNERPRRPSFSEEVHIPYSYLWDIAEMCVVVEPVARPDMAITLSLFEQLTLAMRTSSKPTLIAASRLREILEKKSVSTSTVVVEDVGASITNVSARPFNTSGVLADLYSGTHITVGNVALKQRRPAVRNQKSMVAELCLFEAQIWRRLRHPRLLQFIGIAEIDGVVNLVSPYIAQGTIITFMKANPGIDGPRLLAETADAISFLHECEIIHGDINANNVLISDDFHALVCGFGFTRPYSPDTGAEMRSGTSSSAQSPKLGHEGTQSFKSDVYNFGITVIEVLTGKARFWADAMDFAVLRGAFFEERPSDQTPLAAVSNFYSYSWDIAEMCAEAKPDARPDMSIVHTLFARLTGGIIPQTSLVHAVQHRDALERERRAAIVESPQSDPALFGTPRDPDKSRDSNIPLAELLIFMPELAPAISAMEAIYSLIPEISYKREHCRRLAREAMDMLSGLDAPQKLAAGGRSRTIALNQAIAGIHTDFSQWSHRSLLTGMFNKNAIIEVLRKHEKVLNELKQEPSTARSKPEPMAGAPTRDSF